MQINEQQFNIAEEILELVATELGNKRAVHPGTAIASCARLAGSFMFRSFNFEPKNIAPGNVVLSEEANEKGPILINLVVGILKSLSVDIDNKKISESSKADSNLSILQSLDLLQNKAITIMDRHKLAEAGSTRKRRMYSKAHKRGNFIASLRS